MVRSHALYPTELRARNAGMVPKGRHDFSKLLKNQLYWPSDARLTGGERIARHSRGRESYHTLAEL